MQIPPGNINTQEKKRLRDTIANQVRRYLERGGNITVLDTPPPDRHRHSAPSWHAGNELDVLLD
jgi:hypothetical protein